MRWLARLLTAAAALGTAATVNAESAAPSSAPTVAMPPWVELRVVGDETALSRVRVTAAELFARLDVRLSVVADGEGSASMAGDSPLVLAYIDLRVPTAPLVDVDDGRTRQELMRRNLRDLSSLETGVEAAVHVVYTTVESLLQLAKTERASARPRTPPPRAPAGPLRGTGLDVGALFRLLSLGDSHLVPGAGAAVELRTDAGPVQAELSLLGALHTASRLDFGDGSASLRPYALRLLPGVSARISEQLLGAVGVGVGLDHFVLDASDAPSGSKGHDRAVFEPVLASQLGLRFALGGAWFMSVLGTLDVDLAPTRFVIDRASERQVLFELPRWRGGLLLVASLSPTPVRRFSGRGAEP
ncbi:MAG TPA: hypothetical protein VEQ59_22865 [Polyangiaceae bacterium]|nr:hypothetical protein [Polyangiaceae bacterium]